MSRAFSGDKAFLSNFYVYFVGYKGQAYLSSEHAYQSEKCALETERLRVMAAPSPWEAKKLGRIILLKTGWDAMKLDVMHEVVRAKFKVPFLAEKLLATGEENLIEVNDWHDTYWGVCDGQCRKPKAHVMGRPRGENRLGQILMEVRSELRAASE